LAEEANQEEPLNLTLDRSALSKQLLQHELVQVPEGPIEEWQEDEPVGDPEEGAVVYGNEPTGARPPQYLEHDLWAEIEGDALYSYGRRFGAK